MPRRARRSPPCSIPRRCSAGIRALPGLAARPAMLAKGLDHTALLWRMGIKVWRGVTPVAIEGAEGVEQVRFRDAAGASTVIACDAVGIGHGLRSETQLADLARCDFAFDEHCPPMAPRHRSGWADLGQRRLSCRRRRPHPRRRRRRNRGATGRLHRARRPRRERRRGRNARPALRPRSHAPLPRGPRNRLPWPAHFAAALPDEAIVCRCECITAGELRGVATEKGAPGSQPRQSLQPPRHGTMPGRMCGLAGAEVLADALNVPLRDVGRLRSQGPVRPLPTIAEIEP
jgi:hypothetical protein